MNDTAPLIRVLFWLPMIFLASYLVAGAVLAFIAALWPWIIGGITALVGVVLLAAKAS